MQAKLSLRTQTKIGLAQLLSGRLLRVPGADLEQLVWRELADNPALELISREDLPGAQTRSSSSSADTPAGDPAAPPGRLIITSSRGADSQFEEIAETVVARPAAIDQLIAQAALSVDEADLESAIYLLRSLDQHGYLRSTPEELAVELNMSTASVERVVQLLHELDPPGIGARDLRECLLIQCRHLETDGVDCLVVRRILTEVWADFADQRWRQVAQKLGLPVSVVEEARRFIAQNFYPYPLRLVEDGPDSHETFAYADMIIHREPGGCGEPSYTLEIPQAETLELAISSCFERALRADAAEARNLSAGEKSWVRTHVERARLFITALNQRWATLRRIGEYLMDYQAEFLNSGPRFLKPLTRAAVAKVLDLHESTVSRAVNDKTVQLPGGQIVPLSDFFDPSLATKEAIRQLLAHNTYRPLNDHQIAHHLRAEGLNLARRTVAKYRHQLNIPPSYRR